MPVLSFLQGIDPVVLLVKSSAARKRDAETRLRFYTDRQNDDLLEMIRQRWSDPTDFRLFFVNVVRKVVNRRALVYKLAPVRTFDGMKQDDGDALYRALGANVALKKANRLTKLLKTTALQVAWNGTRPALHVITPNVLDAVADAPENPTRLIVTHPGIKQDGRLSAEADTTYSDWTANTFTRRDYRGQPLRIQGNPDGVNPYGVLPFVPLFDAAPDDKFFLDGGADLIEAQRAVNVGLANLWRAIELQSHGQAWAAGLPAGDAVRAGPDRTITLPTEGKFGFASPNTPIEGVLMALEFVIKQVAVTNDLAANVFELKPRAESGAAKAAENRDLLEARQDDIELWRGYEARLFEVLKRVVNTHTPGAIPENATVRVDFGEITESISDTDRLDSYQRKIDMAIWSPVDALMADNPDIRARDEALVELQRRREESATLGIGFAGPRFERNE